MDRMGALASPLMLLLLLATAACQARAAGMSQGVKCPTPCPDTSQCTSVKGAPVCICPPSQHFNSSGLCTDQFVNMDQAQWVDPMNNARAAVGAPMLVWDDDVAATAQSYAQVLAQRPYCTPKHRVPPHQGQNLAGGSQKVPAAMSNGKAVDWRVAEGGTYSPTKSHDSNPGGCKAGKWKECGHYVQVVWSGTRKVGCAVQTCQTGKKKGKVWVCNYFPAGNIIGRYPYRMDACFTTYCPPGSTCNSDTGVGVCQCPEGQALVGGSCVADPCLETTLTCEGDKVCDGSTGSVQCKCPPPLINFPPESGSCLPPRCLGVECPGASVCAMADGNPSSQRTICTCKPGLYLVDGDCVTSVTTPVAATSMELYAPDAVAPAILRFPVVAQGYGYAPACINLVDEGIVDKLAVPRLAVYSITWNAPVSLGPVPDAVDAVPCRQLQFWVQSNCGGTAKFWTISAGNITKLALRDKIFRMTSSIKCIF